jgi:hypothetical protein
MPRHEEALLNLRKMASFVKPIMMKRGWHVGTLQEFLPDDPRLYGTWATWLDFEESKILNRLQD